MVVFKRNRQTKTPARATRRHPELTNEEKGHIIITIAENHSQLMLARHTVREPHMSDAIAGNIGALFGTSYKSVIRVWKRYCAGRAEGMDLKDIFKSKKLGMRNRKSRLDTQAPEIRAAIREVTKEHKFKLTYRKMSLALQEKGITVSHGTLYQVGFAPSISLCETC
jgi:hypothetical protein